MNRILRAMMQGKLYCYTRWAAMLCFPRGTAGIVVMKYAVSDMMTIGTLDR